MMKIFKTSNRMVGYITSSRKDAYIIFTTLNLTLYSKNCGLQGMHYFSYFAKKNLKIAEAVVTSNHNLCFEQKYEKSDFFYYKFSFSWL